MAFGFDCGYNVLEVVVRIPMHSKLAFWMEHFSGIYLD
jgi:hypothetical protein